MILIAAVDDRGGLTFNRRRQSQDRILRQQILSMTAGKRLWMDHYTAGQFEQPLAPQIIPDDDYLARAAEEDYCFMERCPSSLRTDCIHQVILFRWNRRYPADVSFPIRLESPEWQMIHTEEFPGYSHEKITKEVWKHEKEI